MQGGGAGVSAADDRDEQAQFAGRLWLLLLKEGGHWSCSDIADELRVEAETVRYTMRALHTSGYVQRFDSATEKGPIRYGITAACKFPRAVTFADVLAVGALQLAAEPSA